MKIVFDEYETSRTEMPMAPANIATATVKQYRRAGVTPSWIAPRADTRLFHAWRA